MPKVFLENLTTRELSVYDQAIALLWWSGRDDVTRGMRAKDIAAALEAVGHAKQNTSRLNRYLAEDRRTSKCSDGGWRLRPNVRKVLDAEYSPLVKTRSIAASDSVLPRDLFENTRGYLEKVVAQVNASYDTSLYDCCAVMCRRVLETLIIEVYEGAGRASDIKGPDNHFLMLSGLVAYLEKDTSFNLGRNAIRGLKDFKQLGDQAAHNRRFNARRDDIDRIRDGLRIASEELLHLAKMK